MICNGLFAYLLYFLGVSIPNEIVYAFDSSDGTSSEDFRKMKHLLLNEIKQHTPVSKVALVNFGSDVSIESRLTSDQGSLLKILANLKKLGGVRRIDLAFEKIRNDIFTNRYRNLPLRQLVLITTGNNNPPYRKALVKVVEDMRNVKIAVVPIGKNVNKDGFDITPDKASILPVNSSEDMPAVVDDIFSVISDNAGMIV